MKHAFTTLVLAPILIPQALFVRRVTPKLPEPHGDRSGMAGNGDPLRLLIIGDSAAAGVGAASQQEALAGQLVAALTLTHQVHWTLIAETGRKIEDVNQILEDIPAQQFDVALISIGVNDVTSGTSRRNWTAGLERLAATLLAKFKAKHLLYTSIPPMEVFPALPQPLRWYLGQRAQQLNASMESVIQQHEISHFLSVPFPLEPAYMAIDGFHPGPRAYQVWGQHAAAVIKEIIIVPEAEKIS